MNDIYDKSLDIKHQDRTKHILFLFLSNHKYNLIYVHGRTQEISLSVCRVVCFNGMSIIASYMIYRKLHLGEIHIFQSYQTSEALVNVTKSSKEESNFNHKHIDI